MLGYWISGHTVNLPHFTTVLKTGCNSEEMLYEYTVSKKWSETGLYIQYNMDID